MIKTNIKMRVTPEQSKKVQGICSKNGITKGLSRIDATDDHFLFIFNDRIGFEYISRENFFNVYPPEEVDAELFIRTNGACIEEKNCNLEGGGLKMPNAFKVRVSKEDSHSAHYKAQKIDTITRCKANNTLQEQKAICIFQIDKYVHREKGQNLSDIQKVRDYLDWLEEIEIKLENER